LLQVAAVALLNTLVEVAVVATGHLSVEVLFL